MKTLNKIILGTFTIAAIAFMSNGCTPSAMPYPPGHGCLVGIEYSHIEPSDLVVKVRTTVKLYTDLRINSMERHIDFLEYAFMYEHKHIYREVISGPDGVVIKPSRDTLCHAQTFKFSVSEDKKTLVLHYVDPDELPDELRNPEEYRQKLLGNDDTDDFDLSSKLFINEGDVVLRAANYEDEGVREYDYVLEIDGVEYILEYQYR